MRWEGRRQRAAGCAVAAAVVLAGCSSTTPGNPQPTSVAGETSTTGTSKPPLTLPPRPATLSVTGIDPCALVLRDKNAELGIDQPATHNPDTVDTVIRGRLCSYSVSTWGSYLFELSTKFTAQQWIERTKSRTDASTVVAVGGYPTIWTYASDHAGSCITLVDISSTALLYVAVNDRRDYAAMNGRVVCGNAIKAAGVALAALRGMQK